MILTFMYSFFIGFFICFLLDKLSIYLYKNYNNTDKYSHNIRWFFIHYVINILVTIFAFTDLQFCILNISSCAMNPWINGSLAYGLAVSLHFYHILMFYDVLTTVDWIHHITSAVISTPILLACNMTSSAVTALWFMSGLPGAIDYFLLWLVKMGYLNSMIEKQVYVYLTTWIRMPGCVMSSILQLGIIPHIHTISILQLIGTIWNTLMVYCNGIGFMQLTLKDFYKKNNH